MNRKPAIRSLILLVSIVGVASLLSFRFYYIPDYPEGVLSEPDTYLIKPDTILNSLDQGDNNTFIATPSEPEADWPQLWPPGTFSWDQREYLKIANNLHQFIWKESLDNWHLIRAYFRIDQCRDIFGKIDAANLSFYQHKEGLNNVHGFWVNPMYGYVQAGSEYSHTGSWTAKSIDLDNVKVNTVETALSIAEENGGQNMRSTIKNECRITLLLSPDGLEYDFFSHPLTRYGWGWNVIYWSNKSNSEPLFSIVIDPYTGRHRTLSTK